MSVFSGVKISGDNIQLFLNRAPTGIRRGFLRGFYEVRPLVIAEMVRLIEDPPASGRLYYHGGKLHQASAPGEAPANMDGDLARSIEGLVDSDSLEVGSDLFYAKILEEGSDKIAKRPFVRRAGLSMIREVRQYLDFHVMTELLKNKR